MCKTGFTPRRIEAIVAKCCDCTANYGDGRTDCLNTICPLYYKMPYRKKKPNFSWIFGPWNKKIYNLYKEGKIKNKKEYINSLPMIIKNNRMTYPNMIRAKCFRCNNNFYLGKKDKIVLYDCEITECPLYYWQPYRKLEPGYNWLFDLNYTNIHNNHMKLLDTTREEYVKIKYWSN